MLGTSSSESALPRIMAKLERLGCAKPVVGLVVPTGYSFNLDGTSIYMTMAAIFVAQASGVHLSLAAGARRSSACCCSPRRARRRSPAAASSRWRRRSRRFPTIPVAGLTLLLGVDRFMSEARAITNLIGNAVATMVVAKWDGALDLERANAILGGEERAAPHRLAARSARPPRRLTRSPVHGHGDSGNTEPSRAPCRRFRSLLRERARTRAADPDAHELSVRESDGRTSRPDRASSTRRSTPSSRNCRMRSAWRAPSTPTAPGTRRGGRSACTVFPSAFKDAEPAVGFPFTRGSLIFKDDLPAGGLGPGRTVTTGGCRAHRQDEHLRVHDGFAHL